MLRLTLGATAVFALLLLGYACTGGAGQPRQRDTRVIAGKATVIDGDGLEISGIKIRLFGIDAPEIGQYCIRQDGSRWRCGQYATVVLDRMVGGKDVSCTSRQKDRYGRPVAVCTLDGRDVAGELARGGWVLAYRNFSKEYADEEELARKERAGVWSGELEAPWAWRQRMRAGGKYDR